MFGSFFRRRMPPTPPARPALPAEIHWSTAYRPLDQRWVGLQPTSAAFQPSPNPFDFTAAMRRVCKDVAFRCEALGHVRMNEVLVSFTASRSRSKYGLQARVTPLRFRGGALSRRQRGREYAVQRFFLDGREMLYVVTFCLPRFLDQTFNQKMITIFHELYHIAPAFDGDLRRHPGRCTFHTHSKKGYDAAMAELVREYLKGHPDPGLFEFLRLGYRDLWHRHGGLRGVVVPRPKMYPVPG